MTEIDINNLEPYYNKLVSIYNGNNHWVCRIGRNGDGGYIFESLKGNSKSATKLAYSGLKNIKILSFSELNMLDSMISICIQSLPKL